MIGWDLLYQLIAQDLRTESDIIVAVAHWFLIKEAGFRCLGNGDEVIKCSESIKCLQMHEPNNKIMLFSFYGNHLVNKENFTG